MTLTDALLNARADAMAAILALDRPTLIEIASDTMRRQYEPVAALAVQSARVLGVFLLEGAADALGGWPAVLLLCDSMIVGVYRTPAGDWDASLRPGTHVPWFQLADHQSSLLPPEVEVPAVNPPPPARP